MKRTLYLSPGDHLLQNDDDIEIQLRKRDSLPSQGLVPQRKSLSFNDASSVEIFWHYSQCLKLSAENKINAKNAFQLQLIDYMSNMVKSKDAQMENFQVVSSALDASTKIYASRVDRVHMDGLKMAGGMGQTNAKENQTEAPEEKEKVKLKSSSKPKADNHLAKNVEMLNSPGKDDNRIHPLFLYMKNTFRDSRPGFPVFMTKLSVQDDSNKINFMYSDNSAGQGNIKLNPCLKEFRELPDINFLKLANYTCEPADLIVEELAQNLENFHISPNKYDMTDAIEDFNEQLDMENNFEDEVTIEEFGEITTNSGNFPSTSGNVKDLRHAITSMSEYSYFDAEKLPLCLGPSYWNMPFAKGNAAGVKTKKVQRKQKTVTLFQEPVDCKKEYVSGKNTKFLKKSIIKTWLPGNISYPQDLKFNVTELQRYYLLSTRGFSFNTTSYASTTEEDCNYDYNNLNDTHDFCQNILDEDEDNDMNDAIDDPEPLRLSYAANQNEDLDLNKTMKLNDDLGIQPSWNLLTPSYKVASTTVPYALVPKKVNMAELKSCMWTIITDSQEKFPEERGKINGGHESHFKFSNVFCKLKICLPQDMAQDLSVALAFSSLLHLCNEKNLKLTCEGDLRDIQIESDDDCA